MIAVDPAPLYLTAFLVVGLSVSFLGPAFSEFRERTGSDLGAIGVLFVTQSVGYIVGSLGGGGRSTACTGTACSPGRCRDGAGARHGAARERTRRLGDRVRGARRRGRCRRPRRQHDADLAPWERGRPVDEPVAPVLRARCPVVATVGATRSRYRRDRRRDRRLSHRRLGIAGASARLRRRQTRRAHRRHGRTARARRRCSSCSTSASSSDSADGSTPTERRSTSPPPRRRG